MPLSVSFGSIPCVWYWEGQQGPVMWRTPASRPGIFCNIATYSDITSLLSEHLRVKLTCIEYNQGNLLRFPMPELLT